MAARNNGAEGQGKVSSKEVPFAKLVRGVQSNPQIVSLVILIKGCRSKVKTARGFFVLRVKMSKRPGQRDRKKKQ